MTNFSKIPLRVCFGVAGRTQVTYCGSSVVAEQCSIGVRKANSFANQTGFPGTVTALVLTVVLSLLWFFARGL